MDLMDLMANDLLQRIKQYDDDRAFLRQFTIPEEDRARYTTMKWSGEFRWFRAANVVCLEKARAVLACGEPVPRAEQG
jgi:hypothetical protein